MYKILTGGSNLKCFSYSGSSNLLYSVKASGVVSWCPDGLSYTLTSDTVSIYSADGNLSHVIPLSGVTVSKYTWRSARLIYLATLDKLYKWDCLEKKLSLVATTHPGDFVTLSFSLDDSRLAIGSSTGQISILSLRHGTTTRLNSPFEQGITCADFYPFKKNILAVGGADGSIALFDLNGTVSPTLIKKSIHLAPVKGVAFAPCNKHFFCSVSLDGSLLFHDIQSAQSGILQSCPLDVPLLCVSINDEHTVACGTTDGRVIVYDIRTKSVVHTISIGSPVSSVAFQPVKWVQDACHHETREVPTPSTSSSGITPVSSVVKTKSENVLDIFSPIGRKTGGKLNMRQNLLEKKLQAASEPTISSFLSDPILAVHDADHETPQRSHLSTPVPSSGTTSFIPQKSNSSTLIPQKSMSILQKTDTPSPIQETPQKSEIVKGLQTPLSKLSALESSSLSTHMSSLKRDLVDRVQESLSNISLAPKSGNEQVPIDQMEAIEKSIEDCISGFEDRVRSDLRDIHVELIRQFHLQKLEFTSMLQEFKTANSKPSFF